MNKYSLENSSKDDLIKEFIKDPLYDVRKDGSVWTKLTLNGQGITEDWREMGYVKPDGYIRLRYQDDFLFVHRIVYWKFKGPIEPGYTIDHKDRDRSNNKPDNLQAKTQGDNNQNKTEKYKKKVANMDKSTIVAKVITKLAKGVLDSSEVTKLCKQDDKSALLKYLRQWRLADVSEFIETSKLNSDVLDKLYELDMVKSQTHSFIANPNTPEKVVDKILKDEGKSFKEEISSNPKTPIKVLEKLADLPSWEIKFNVIHNPSTPKKIIETFAKGSDKAFAEEAEKVLNSKPKSLLEKAKNLLKSKH